MQIPSPLPQFLTSSIPDLKSLETMDGAWSFSRAYRESQLRASEAPESPSWLLKSGNYDRGKGKFAEAYRAAEMAVDRALKSQNNRLVAMGLGLQAVILAEMGNTPGSRQHLAQMAFFRRGEEAGTISALYDELMGRFGSDSPEKSAEYFAHTLSAYVAADDFQGQIRCHKAMATALSSRGKYLNALD